MKTPSDADPRLLSAAALLLIVAAFLVTRFLYLDSDAPLFGETEYATIDEFYYATKALFWDRQHLYDRFADILNHYPFQWLSNLATYVGLEVLGTNLYGFRASAVVAGLVCLLATYAIVARRFGVIYAIFCGLYLLVDYHFMLASRIVEPTIYRTAIVLVTLLLARSYLVAVAASPTGEAGVWRRVLYTAFVMALYFLEYPTNYFVVVCWLVMLVVCERLTIGAVLSRVAQFVCVTAIVMGLYVLLIVSQGFYPDAPLRFMQVHTQRLALGDFAYAIAINFYVLLRTQFLLHVPAMGLVFALAGLTFGVMALVRWLRPQLQGGRPDVNTQWDLVMALMLAGTLGHILLENSYPLRKPIILLPLLLIAFCYAVHALAQHLPRWRHAIAPVFLGGVLAYSGAAHVPLAYQKLFAEPRYQLRDASIAMAKYDGAYFLDGYAWVYSLYNSILPVGNNYLIDIIKSPLGPSVLEFERMFREGSASDPTLTILPSNPFYDEALEPFEVVEFVECSYEPRYYPNFIFKRRGVALDEAIASAEVPRASSLAAPLELGTALADCAYYSEMPD